MAGFQLPGELMYNRGPVVTRAGTRRRPGGARLVEKAWMPALRETVYSSHHGGPFAGLDRELFLYSYLTDYDTIQGGILQRLRITDEHLLEPLDPPWVSTGLPDGRQPISVPRSAPR